MSYIRISLGLRIFIIMFFQNLNVYHLSTLIIRAKGSSCQELNKIKVLTEEEEHRLLEASSAVAGSITKEHRQKAKEKLDDWFGDLDES